MLLFLIIVSSTLFSSTLCQVDDFCLMSLCHATTGCDVNRKCLGTGNAHCGPYQISNLFWVDSGSPGESFVSCALNLSCAKITVAQYMGRYARDCDGDGVISCSDYASILRAGPYNCHQPWVFQTPFFQKFLTVTQGGMVNSGHETSRIPSPPELYAPINEIDNEHNENSMEDHDRSLHPNELWAERPRSTIRPTRRTHTSVVPRDSPDLYGRRSLGTPWIVSGSRPRTTTPVTPSVDVDSRRRRVRPNMPRTTSPPRTTPRTIYYPEAPRATNPPRTTPRTIYYPEAPRATSPPRTTPRTIYYPEAPRATNPPRTTPRTIYYPEAPRTRTPAATTTRRRRVRTTTFPSTTPRVRTTRYSRNPPVTTSIPTSTTTTTESTVEFEVTRRVRTSTSPPVTRATTPPRPTTDLTIRPTPTTPIPRRTSTTRRSRTKPTFNPFMFRGSTTSTTFKPWFTSSTTESNEVLPEGRDSNSTSENVIPLSNPCLDCICYASSGCNFDVNYNCYGESECGPYKIDYAYWYEAGYPGYKESAMDDFHTCVTEKSCAEKTVRTYLANNVKDCNDDGVIDCLDYASIHKGGPESCNANWMYESKYWSAFSDCFGFEERSLASHVATSVVEKTTTLDDDDDLLNWE